MNHASTSAAAVVRAHSSSGGPAGAAGGADILSQLRGIVQKSAIGTQVFDELQKNHAQIQVLSDADFQRRYPGAGGIYDPNTNRIYVPQKALGNPQNIALTLVHEGVHWLQDHVGNARLAAIGGALGQAISSHGATGQSRNAKQQDWDDEAQAYIVESLAAKQLGMRDFGLGTDKATGQTLSFNQTIAKVKANPLYRNGG